VGQEPELEASAALLGRPVPGPDQWRRIREQLASASVSTFHSLCRELLAWAPGAEGGGLEVLDERSARALVLECAQALVLEALAQQEARVVRLCEQVNFGGGQREGLVEWLGSMLGRLREDGLSVDTLQVSDLEGARRDLEAARVKAIELARATAPRMKQPLRAEAVRQVAADLGALDVERFAALYPAVLARLGPRDKVKDEHTRAVRTAVEAVGNAWAAVRTAPHELTVRDLLARLQERHAKALQTRGAVDFTGLLVRARDLLRDHGELRTQVQQRFQVLLVDEMQDTNRLQLELICLLAEARQGSPRAFSQAITGSGEEITRIELEPGFLCAVGDRKQSIYEFRGADVTVAAQLQACVEASGGGRAYLSTSYRSTPALTSFFNRAFPALLRPEGQTSTGFAPTSPDRLPESARWDVGYRGEEDDLSAHRPPRPGPAVVALERAFQGDGNPNADEARTVDADAIATYLGWLLGSGRTVHPRGEPAERRVRGGDVALLLRSFTHVESYRQALVRAGVRHRVVQGRGFFHAPEVMDCAALLALIADPSSALSLATVLRSPLVGLSDAAVLCLTGDSGALRAADVLTGKATADALTAPERAELERLKRCWADLRRERDRLSLPVLVEEALGALDARTRYAATPFGEQALANLEKLLGLARAAEQSATPLPAFVHELQTLATVEARESQGELVEEGDTEAVTVCTIHQAKGLEWPVVVLGELFHDPGSRADALIFERNHGLALRPIDTEALGLKSPRFEAVRKVIAERANAEAKRLLYVAVTRACEHLVLGWMGFERGWVKALKGMQAELALADSVHPPAEPWLTRVDTDALELPREDHAAAVNVSSLDPSALLEAAARPPPPAVREMLLPVTQLQDLWQCPRRYRYAWELGLPEQAKRPVVAKDAGDGPDLRLRGIAAHRLLELLPLTPPAPELEAQLTALAAGDGLTVEPEVLSVVARFWRTPFARSLVEAGAGRVFRELPFALRLDDGDGFSLVVRGQIDLVVEDATGTALVVDYKTTRRSAAGVSPYAFQLACYALAAQRFLREGVPVKTGIAFLDDADPSPVWAEAGPLDAVGLARAARAWVNAPVGQEWPVLEVSRCEALGCGYRWRCHGGKRL